MPKPVRILIVEDCPDTATSMATVLELWGMVPFLAHDGRSALRLATVERPDIVLLDLGLPDMHGQDVARAMRAIHCLDRTMIVVISGYATIHDQEESDRIGCQLHLAKPVELERLHTLLIHGLEEFRQHDTAYACATRVES